MTPHRRTRSKVNRVRPCRDVVRARAVRLRRAVACARAPGHHRTNRFRRPRRVRGYLAGAPATVSARPRLAEVTRVLFPSGGAWLALLLAAAVTSQLMADERDGPLNRATGLSAALGCAVW